jgi:hypothetical protein
MDDASGDNDNVPFVEVGAPAPAAARKPTRVLSPTIIPMSRSGRTLDPIKEPSSAYLRIAFQPLPFPGRPEGVSASMSST